MHTKLERLLSKSLTTLEVVMYYLVVHTGPGLPFSRQMPYHSTNEAGGRRAAKPGNVSNRLESPCTTPRGYNQIMTQFNCHVDTLAVSPERFAAPTLSEPPISFVQRGSRVN